MDYSIITFWLVVSSCLAGMTVTWTRVRFAGRGWLVVYLAILLLSVTGWLLEQAAIIYAAAALWFVLVLLPGLIGKLYNRRFMQQDYVGCPPTGADHPVATPGRRLDRPAEDHSCTRTGAKRRVDGGVRNA